MTAPKTVSLTVEKVMADPVFKLGLMHGEARAPWWDGYETCHGAGGREVEQCKYEWGRTAGMLIPRAYWRYDFAGSNCEQATQDFTLRFMQLVMHGDIRS